MDNKIDLKFTSSVDVEKELDTIIGMLKESVENDDRKVTFLNDLRLRQLQFVYACLLYMTRDDEGISVNYKLYEPFKTMGSVTVEGESLEFYEPKWLSRAVEFSSNVEVYPLVNGRVRMTFTFHGLTKPIE